VSVPREQMSLRTLFARHPERLQHERQRRLNGGT
jgi:hypothetical protein